MSWQASAPDDLAPTWITSVKDQLEEVDRLSEFTVPDEGLRPRPPAVNWDDGYGNTFWKPQRDPGPLG
jgi:hypothetical protein